MIIESYQLRGGQHPETASVTNVLAHLGLVAPHTGQPFSEAMIMGISGGLGVGYILWEFKQHNTKALVMEFRNRWQYPVQYLQNLADRLNIPAQFKETSGQKAAAAHLDKALQAGIPAIAWVDYGNLRYTMQPQNLWGMQGHVITVYGLDEARNQALIDDRGKQPFRISIDDLAAARARVGSFKNRLLLLEAPQSVDLKQAVLAGLEDCVDHLSQPSETFSLPVLKKWASMMTHPSNKKGWPVIFADRQGLFNTLRGVYEGIEVVGASGGTHRALYADFLDEAAGVLNRSALNQVAEQYRALSRQWSQFAALALSNDVPAFQEAKALISRRHDLLMSGGTAAWDDLQATSDRLNTLRADLDAHFPLSDAEIDDLFAAMESGLLALYAAETDALTALKAAK